MIDCSKTENYIAEKARMTKKDKLGRCKLYCGECLLNNKNNGTSENLLCGAFEAIYPEKAIEIVQKWSDEHPRKTYLSEFLKNYPNAELNHGVPKVCLKKLGAVSGCAKTEKGDLYISCYRCWNQPIPIEDGENNDKL
nr:MAG TPA: hypothetical protein [Caudoviricetes sp.]